MQRKSWTNRISNKQKIPTCQQSFPVLSFCQHSDHQQLQSVEGPETFALPAKWMHLAVCWPVGWVIPCLDFPTFFSLQMLTRHPAKGSWITKEEKTCLFTFLFSNNGFRLPGFYQLENSSNSVFYFCFSALTEHRTQHRNKQQNSECCGSICALVTWHSQQSDSKPLSLTTESRMFFFLFGFSSPFNGGGKTPPSGRLRNCVKKWFFLLTFCC